IASERPTETAWRNRIHELRTARDARERKPAPKRLPADEEVRLDAVVLDRPDGAGSPDSRLHLVVDVEDPVLFADLLQAAREVVRHRDESTLPLHGLEHDACDRGRVDVLLEQVAERVQRVVRLDAAEGI